MAGDADLAQKQIEVHFCGPPISPPSRWPRNSAAQRSLEAVSAPFLPQRASRPRHRCQFRYRRGDRARPPGYPGGGPRSAPSRTRPHVTERLADEMRAQGGAARRLSNQTFSTSPRSPRLPTRSWPSTAPLRHPCFLHRDRAQNPLDAGHARPSSGAFCCRRDGARLVGVCCWCRPWPHAVGDVVVAIGSVMAARPRAETVAYAAAKSAQFTAFARHRARCGT